jgi:alkanesulfonate monooxygenase SsuD/methylene tetrahydromethanopterin reductase-like flavin-dependent oxidoreductase (luciferase family)
MTIQYGLYLANYGAKRSARQLADFAAEAERAGWDGFFIWDHILGSPTLKVPMVDPWVALAAMAMTTEHIRLGTTVTPIARRRPWKLARETVSLDHLSQGRLILAVGLGEPADAEFTHFGEVPDPVVRAQKLDEGLEILAGLWTGKPFHFDGQHYHLEKGRFLPPARQQPRIPIWVGGWWPNKPPFRRAARWDGAFPLIREGRMKPQDLAEIRTFIAAQRSTAAPFDLVMTGSTPGSDAQKSRAVVQPFEAAGLTWWLENLYLQRNSPEDLLARIRQGPPK